MSQQIGTILVNKFNANLMMLAQQMESRLLSAVRVEQLNGEFGYFDQYGSASAVELVSRNADTPQTDVPFSRRQVGGRDWALGDVIDKQDTAKQLGSPQSAIVKAFAAEMNRKKDLAILRAAFAPANTGKTGTTAVAFPAGQQIADNYVESGTAVSSSLTIGKLRRAREILMDAEVGEGKDLFIACTQRELNALLRTTEVTSSDFNRGRVAALVDGDIDYFMGFNFIRVPSAQIELDGSSFRRIPCWHRQGLLYAAQMEMETNAAPDPTKNFNTRVSVVGSFGATRMEEARVVEIKCSATAF